MSTYYITHFNFKKRRDEKAEGCLCLLLSATTTTAFDFAYYPVRRGLLIDHVLQIPRDRLRFVALLEQLLQQIPWDGDFFFFFEPPDATQTRARIVKGLVIHATLRIASDGADRAILVERQKLPSV